MAESTALDLVGGSFAVIESDPGVFTTLLRKLGVRGLEVTEIYDIEPWATDHLNPRGLIFCYPCNDADDDGEQQNSTFVNDDTFPDPDAEDVWYAHQLSNDACASQAILNVVLNLKGIEMENTLKRFHAETYKMDPIMRGLALTNSHWIREAHNSLARPADLRGAKHAIAKSTLEYAKKQKAAARGPPTKRRKLTTGRSAKGNQAEPESLQDAYHFIGYIPRDGRVWELDSLRQGGPLEVGELSDIEGTSAVESHAGWMNVVRPAIKRRMQSLLSSGSESIRFNLLAIVDDHYESASDELEMLKRERNQLERRLQEEYPNGWSNQVDADLFAARSSVFETSAQSQEPGPTFARDFASRKLAQDMSVLDMPRRNLVPAWERCIKSAMTAKMVVEEKLADALTTHTEHINRTFDYEPFIQAFITHLHTEGSLEALLTKTGKISTPKG